MQPKSRSQRKSNVIAGNKAFPPGLVQPGAQAKQTKAASETKAAEALVSSELLAMRLRGQAVLAAVARKDCKFNMPVDMQGTWGPGAWDGLAAPGSAPCTEPSVPGVLSSFPRVAMRQAGQDALAALARHQRPYIAGSQDESYADLPMAEVHNQLDAQRWDVPKEHMNAHVSSYAFQQDWQCSIFAAPGVKPVQQFEHESHADVPQEPEASMLVDANCRPPPGLEPYLLELLMSRSY
eukprot:TRINITY_DN12053_c1_g1_i1.p1 TRINITY_DN12053_c1_g1~~TRINITY_DN12053_c1_g1_i1.p1  ORF type:complete len:237 (+),score=55.51 TRINITY_DN12053_c1_g1_i1:105-815(+)